MSMFQEFASFLMWPVHRYRQARDAAFRRRVEAAEHRAEVARAVYAFQRQQVEREMIRRMMDAGPVYLEADFQSRDGHLVKVGD